MWQLEQITRMKECLAVRTQHDCIVGNCIVNDIILFVGLVKRVGPWHPT